MYASSTISGTICLANLLPDWNVLDSVRLAHSRFELWSIIFFGMLAFAEAIAHRTRDEKRKDRIDTIGIVFFVLAVAFEGIAYEYGQRNDELSEGVITSLSVKAKQAGDTADAAKTEADSAKTVSDSAKTTSGEANTAAGLAKGKANQVETKVNETKASLEDANNNLALLTASVIDLRTPRKLKDVEGLRNELKHLAGSRYEMEVFFNIDSMDIAKSLDMEFMRAGMLWLPPPPGYNSVTLNETGTGARSFAANNCPDNGIQVRINPLDVEESNAYKTGVNRQLAPTAANFGQALLGILSRHFSPENTLNVSDVMASDSRVPKGLFVVCVGEKPINGS